MRKIFPDFKNPFLDGICRAFDRRRKPIAYHGTLEFDASPEGELEWIEIRYSSFNRPVLILQIDEEHRVCFYLRSNEAHNRGKVLFRLEDVRLVDNPSVVVECFEATIAESFSFDTEKAESIRAEWGVRSPTRVVQIAARLGASCTE